MGVYSALDGESEEAADDDNAVSTDIAADADRADSAANADAADNAEAASAADNTTRKQGEEHDEKSVSSWN